MRSVVVVLPASMCAMIPMLRTLVRSVSTSFCATEVFPLFRLLGYFAVSLDPAPSPGVSPAIVRERAVCLGHLVGVLAPLHGGTQAIAGIQDLVRQALDHGLLTTLLGEADQPAQCQRDRALRTHLDRHLVGGATDTAATHLEGGFHVVHCALQRDHRV